MDGCFVFCFLSLPRSCKKHARNFHFMAKAIRKEWIRPSHPSRNTCTEEREERNTWNPIFLYSNWYLLPERKEKLMSCFRLGIREAKLWENKAGDEIPKIRYEVWYQTIFRLSQLESFLRNESFSINVAFNTNGKHLLLKFIIMRLLSRQNITHVQAIRFHLFIFYLLQTWKHESSGKIV